MHVWALIVTIKIEVGHVCGTLSFRGLYAWVVIAAIKKQVGHVCGTLCHLEVCMPE